MRKVLFYSCFVIVMLLISAPLPLQATETKVGTLQMPYEGNVTSAIYEENGQLVRILSEIVPQKTGPVTLQWDGRDSYGNLLPNGKYQWRAITSQVKAYDDGQVGQGNVATPATVKLAYSNSVFGLAYDNEGNLFTASFWEEHHNDLRKWDRQMNPVWGKNYFGGITIALDEKYIYCAREMPEGKGNRIERLDIENGNLINWTGAPQGYLLANEGKNGVFGLAVDGKRLWVSNFTKQRVELYDVETGAFLSSFPLSDPYGITLDNQGNAWICNSQSKVTQYSPDGVKGKEITGLQKPYAIDFGGVKNYLYIAEVASGKVLEYDSNNLTRKRALFGAATPGRMSDNLFRWPTNGYCGIAVDAAGNIACQDAGNHRVQLFDNAGKLRKSIYSEFQPAPFVDPTVDPNILLSTFMQYTIDYTPGENYGHWYPSHNWMPTDTKLNDNNKSFSNSAIRRRLANGKDYIFFLAAAGGVVIHQLFDNDMRLSSVIGRDGQVLYNWSDGNGNGLIDPEEKVTSPGNANYQLLAPGCWVDNKGNFWIANWGGATVRVDCEGFDARANPIYNWQNRKTIVPPDNSRWKFEAKNLRVDPVSGDIFRLGTIEQNRFIGGLWMAGTAVERLTAGGERVSVYPLPATPKGNISDINVVVATDSDGEFFYLGHDNSSGPQWVNMYTKDSLLVAIAACGEPNNFFGGWMDHGMGLTAFTHTNGAHYAYSEDVYYGKSIRFRYDNVKSIKRFSADFEWKATELPQVSVTASSKAWREAGGDTAQYTIARDSIYGSLTVKYAITGTLSQADYKASPELTGSVIIPENQKQVTFTLKSIDDDLRESPDETITLAIVESADYAIAEKAEATLTQLDDDVLVQVSATTPKVTEGDTEPGIWKITRDSKEGNLTVRYMVNQPPAEITKITASSYYQGTEYLPEHLIDGDFATVWQTKGNSASYGKDDAPWVIFKLAQAYPLDYLEVVNIVSSETGRAVKDVEIFTSLDGVEYTSQGIKQLTRGFSDAKKAVWQVVDLGGVVAEYVKLSVKTNWVGRIFQQDRTFDGKFPNMSIIGLSEIRFLQPGAHAEDYNALPGTVVIPNGADSVQVELKIKDDKVAEVAEGVTLSILADPSYKVGPVKSAEITIIDNEPPLAEVSMAIENSTVSKKVGKPALVTFTRSTTLGDLTVKYATAATKAEIVSVGSSSDYPGNYAASNSYDGDLGSYWQNAGNSDNLGQDDAPYITYTFDRIYRINTLKVANLFGGKIIDMHRSINEVEILVSTDGINFTSLGVKKFTPGGYNLADAHFQSLELGGVPAIRIMLKVKSNYFPRVFGEGKSFDGKWPNASIVGISEIAFYEGGSASSDDYQETLTGSVIIPDGKTSVTITVTPKADAVAKEARTLMLSINADGAYLLGKEVKGEIIFLAE